MILYYNEIFVGKNNKYSPVNMAHLAVISVLGEKILYLIKVEARSYRKVHSGENCWDVFYIVPVKKEGWENLPYHFKVLQVSDHEFSECKYVEGKKLYNFGGDNYFLYILKDFSTPMGVEREILPIEIQWIGWKELSTEMLEVLKETVAWARNQGFGPHGYIYSEIKE